VVEIGLTGDTAFRRRGGIGGCFVVFYENWYFSSLRAEFSEYYEK
jgi:hypothetical protein